MLVEPENVNSKIYDVADKFINLANDLTKEDSSGAIGVGLRYAAARYTSFEASFQTDDIARDKEKIIETILKNKADMEGKSEIIEHEIIETAKITSPREHNAKNDHWHKPC